MPGHGGFEETSASAGGNPHGAFSDYRRALEADPRDAHSAEALVELLQGDIDFGVEVERLENWLERTLDAEHGLSEEEHGRLLGLLFLALKEGGYRRRIEVLLTCSGLFPHQG